MKAEPTLDDLWNGDALFKSELPGYYARSVNLEGDKSESGGGKLSLGRLRDGRYLGVYRRPDPLRDWLRRAEAFVGALPAKQKGRRE